MFPVLHVLNHLGRMMMKRILASVLLAVALITASGVIPQVGLVPVAQASGGDF